VLAREGGLYADVDTLFVAAPPPRLWNGECVLGREPDVTDPRTGRPHAALSNALIIAAPGAQFVTRWRDRLAESFDGSWAAHSCFLAAELAEQHPDELHVEPQRTFHPFPPTVEGLRRLLVGLETDLRGVVSIHLAAHLWWEQQRTDFVPEVYGRLIDERWIRAAATTYAAAARPFLPHHGSF
jgi:hypothetical protein